MIWMVR